VFRDQEEFPASADLGRAIRKALGAARTLIVIGSPRSARSHWVGEEIRYFKQLGRSNRIYCLIADGELVDAGEGDNDRSLVMDIYVVLPIRREAPDREQHQYTD
jgi:hypothetical protein